MNEKQAPQEVPREFTIKVQSILNDPNKPLHMKAEDIYHNDCDCLGREYNAPQKKPRPLMTIQQIEAVLIDRMEEKD